MAPSFPFVHSAPRLRPPFLVLLGFIAACVVAPLPVQMMRGSSQLLPVIVAVSIAAFTLVLVVGWRFTRPIQPPPVVVGDRELSLPADVRARVAQTLPLEDVTGVDERVRAKGARFVVIGTRRGFFMYTAPSFQDPTATSQIVTALRDAIARLPNGAQQLAAIDVRGEAAAVALRRKPTASLALTAILALVFAVELIADAPHDNVALVRLGANAPVLVMHGEWWRLFTAGFLHLSWLHILLNVSALLSLGSVLERLLGVPRFTVCALAGGLGGNLAVLLGAGAVSCGSSSMIFGLIGALLVVNLRHKSELPTGFYLGPRRWVSILAPNVVISMLPFVSSLAHLGGFVAGAVCAFALTQTLNPIRTRTYDVVAFASSLAFAAALSFGAFHALTATEVTDTRALVRVAFATHPPPEKVNKIAWPIAIDPNVDPELLALASDACVPAMAAAPTNAALIDTCAHLAYRQHLPADALALERRAAWIKPDPNSFTMLSRYFDETHASTAATVVRAASDLEAHAEPGAVVYARVHRAGAPVGIVRIVLASGAAETSVPAPAEVLPDDVIAPLFSDTGATRPETPGIAAQVRFEAWDPKAAAYP